MKKQKYKMQEIYEGLYDGPHATPPVSDSGAVFLGISNITPDGHIDYSDIRYINEIDLPKWTKRVTPKGGDIVFSYEATLNLYAIIPEGFWGCLGRRMALIRPDESKALGKYLYYYFYSDEWRATIAENTIAGSTVDRIPIAKFPEFPITLPDLSAQKKIADTLSVYDDLIENNQKQIKLLEEAAQRLYKEWFVDLRFPGHEDTEIVDGLPVRWKKQGLSEIAPILTGKKDANFGTEDGKYLFFTCAQEPIKAPSYSIDCDAVILAGNGDFNVKLYRGKFEAYQRTYVFSPFDSEHLYLLYHAVRENMRQLFQGASGSTIKFLTKRMLEDIVVYIPDEQLLKKYNNNAEAVQRKIECLKDSINRATEARDRLLPKLMSGEIEL